MTTIHVEEKANKYITDALKKLESLESVNITKKATSHYNYGTEEPFIRDRFDIEISSKAVVVHCQVVFDSSNYYLSPDIIFTKAVIDQAFDIEDTSVLLPKKGWSLKDENCLYDWFQSIISKLKEPSKSSTLLAAPAKERKKHWDIFDVMDDSDEDFVITNTKGSSNDGNFMRVTASNSKKRVTEDEELKDTTKNKKLKATRSVNSLDKYGISSGPDAKTTEKKKSNENLNASNLFDSLDGSDTADAPVKNKAKAASSSLVDKLNSYEIFDIEEREEKKPAKTIDLMKKKSASTQGPSKLPAMRLAIKDKWEEEFMRLWIKKHSDHILQYDGKDAGPVTMYMSFVIDQKSDEWLQYSWDKKESLDAFKVANKLPPTFKISQPKPIAPMIVHLDPFPSYLKVKLISPMNTNEKEPTGVDRIDLMYEFNKHKSIGSEVTRIRNDITKQAIHFHLFQTKREDDDLV